MDWKPIKSSNWDGWKEEAFTILESTREDNDSYPDTNQRLAELAFRLATENIGLKEQLQTERLARRLVPFRDSLPPFRYLKVGLVSERTLDFLIPAFQAAGLCRLLLIEPWLAPLDSAMALAHNASEPVIDDLDAIIYWHDATTTFSNTKLLDQVAEDSAIEMSVQRIRQISTGLREKFGAEVFISTTPVPLDFRISSVDASTAGTLVRYVDRMNQALYCGSASGEWTLVDIAALASNIGYRSWFDPMRSHETKVPYAHSHNPVVGDFLARVLASHFGKSRRALVLDLDNTVWGGTIGDDGIEGIDIGQGSPGGESYRALQSLVLELKRRGIVICVCSKNDDEIARLPFRKHPDMLLRESDIAVFHASWDDKATGIKAIADTLCLGLDSLVFFDDNPAERARVRQELPFVLVPELPTEPADFSATLASCGAFEHQLLNSDDVIRAESYVADAKRANVRTKVGNFRDYLRSLEMVMTISPFNKVGMSRISQLVNKSNQFNLTTRRHSKEDLCELASRDDYLCWQVRLRDSYSDHGMIAVIVVFKAKQMWIIDTWLQSCRILEREVEHTIANLLLDRASEDGVFSVYGQYIPSSRNSMVANLFERLGFRECDAPALRSKSDGNWYQVDPRQFQPHETEIAITLKQG